MKVIAPITMTDSILIASNVAETDAAAWAVGTTYALDAEVMVLSVHRTYKSARAGNIGFDPVVDDGTNWIEIGATNRWKAFDGKISDPVTGVGSITYTIEAPVFCSGIGFLNIGASDINVQVWNSAMTSKLYDRSFNRFENSSIIDYWTFFTTDISNEDVRDTIFDEMLGYAGNLVLITLSGVNPSADVSVGQIVLGTSHTLGVTLSGTSIGIKDYSTKDRDIYGNAIIVPRAFSDVVSFQFTLPTITARRTKAILAGLRATPALFYAETGLVGYGAQVYGFFQDFDIPLDSGGTSFANLKVEGLT